MSHQLKNENGVRPTMKRQPSGRRERHSEETRDRIFHAALQLFAERGFSATTIESITDAADVGKGTFFNYFENKESILMEFRERQMAKIKGGVGKSMDSNVPLAIQLYELAVSLNEETGKSPALFQSILTAAFSSEILRKRMSEGLSQGRQMLSELIAQRQQRGEIRTDLEPEAIAHAFQRMVFGSMVICSLSPTNPFEENLKKMTDVFLNGVKSR